MLEGINLTKSFNRTVVTHDVSLSIERGEIAVLIGPSGSGKTTLIKMLGLIEHPDSGLVLVDRQVHGLNSKCQSPWPKVTFVFQQFNLWPHLTLLQNITLPIKVHGREVDQKLLSNLLERFDMTKFIHRYPNEASVGQRQRAALVRALMLKPDYLLLDEITSALDVEQIAVLAPYLRALSGTGTGVLVITHLLHFAKETADKVLFMDAGRIIESGGRDVLYAPKEERVRRFVSVLEFAV